MCSMKFELDEKQNVLEVSGTTKDVATSSLFLISLVYSRLRQRDPAVADAYKALIQLGINAEGSPVFAPDAATVGNGVGITIITPPRGETT